MWEVEVDGRKKGYRDRRESLEVEVKGERNEKEECCRRDVEKVDKEGGRWERKGGRGG
jgi:hypothetical protein